MSILPEDTVSGIELREGRTRLPGASVKQRRRGIEEVFRCDRCTKVVAMSFSAMMSSNDDH